MIDDDLVTIELDHAIAKYWTCGGLLHIESLYVERGYRSQGIGRQLLRRCIDRAKSLGCKYVTLKPDPTEYEFTRDGLPAHQLDAWYERNGFVSEPETGRMVLTLTKGGK